MRLPIGKESYCLPRELYSVTALTDEHGTIVEAATYDTYGQVAVYDGAAQTVEQLPVGNPYYFTGRRLDLQPFADRLKQAYHYRGREYDSGNGRFMQRDPLQYVDGMSLQEYVSSKPAGLVDPFGWKKDTPLWIRTANLVDRYIQLWEIYSEEIPDDDPGKAKAQTLMRHYVYGFGRLFEETWDGFMEDRPELQVAIRPVLEAEAARLCASNAHGATGKINLRTSAKLNQLMSMRLTLHGGQVTITDDWKVLQPPGTAACSCRVTLGKCYS